MSVLLVLSKRPGCNSRLRQITWSMRWLTKGHQRGSPTHKAFWAMCFDELQFLCVRVHECVFLFATNQCVWSRSCKLSIAMLTLCQPISSNSKYIRCCVWVDLNRCRRDRNRSWDDDRELGVVARQCVQRYRCSEQETTLKLYFILFFCFVFFFLISADCRSDRYAKIYK